MTFEPISFCLPSCEALKGQMKYIIPIPKPTPCDLESQFSFYQPKIQPLTQPVSPRYHRSPEPKRYQLPINISIDNYNLNKKQQFTEKFTIDAINMLQINPNLLFIDPQKPLEPQINRITILQNEVRQVRNMLKEKFDKGCNYSYQKPINSSKTPIITPKINNQNFRKNRIYGYQSRLDCIRERNKQHEKRTEELAIKNQEEALKQQKLLIKANEESKKRIINNELSNKRALSNLQRVQMKVVPIVF